jgi:hypothetical protein
MWRAGSPDLLPARDWSNRQCSRGLGRAQVLAKLLTNDEYFGEYFGEQRLHRDRDTRLVSRRPSYPRLGGLRDIKARAAHVDCGIVIFPKSGHARPRSADASAMRCGAALWTRAGIACNAERGRRRKRCSR